MTMASLIKVLVVEDHLITRLGLTMFLKQSPSIEVVGEAADGLSALQMVNKVAPDVVLLDIGLPGIDGIECLRRIKNENSKARVMMRSSHHEIGAILGALRAGADAFNSKDSPDDLLVLAIEKVASGRAWLDPCVAREILTALESNALHPNLPTTVKAAMLDEEIALLDRIARATAQDLEMIETMDPTNSLAALMVKLGSA